MKDGDRLVALYRTMQFLRKVGVLLMYNRDAIYWVDFVHNHRQ